MAYGVPVSVASSDRSPSVPGLAQLFETVLDAAADQRELTTAETDLFVEVGGAGFDIGLSLSGLVEAYFGGTGQLWEGVLGTAPADQAIPLGRALRRVSEQAVTGLAAGFEAAQRRSIRAEVAIRREFVDDLLAGIGGAPGLTERAMLVGFAVASTYVVVVVEGERHVSDSGPVHTRMGRELAARAPERSFEVFTRAGQLVVVAADSDPNGLDVIGSAIQAAEPGEWRIGVGGRRSGLEGVSESYTEAVQAIRLGRLFGVSPVAVFDDLILARLLSADRAVATSLFERVIEPLERAPRGSLIPTLRALVDHGGNMAETARELDLGPRSVAYRIDRIAELTGYSPRIPDQRLVLELAIRALPLRNPPPAGTG